MTEMLRVGSVELCAHSFGRRGDPAVPDATLPERGVGHEFVRHGWPTVIPAVPRVSGG